MSRNVKLHHHSNKHTDFGGHVVMPHHHTVVTRILILPFVNPNTTTWCPWTT